MSRLDPEAALSALELQQLIADWGHELDANGGLGLMDLCTEDCNYVVGGTSFRGRAAVRRFYVDRGERVRTQQKDGVRTQRHTISNLRISFQDASRANLEFTIVNYSGEGKAPVFGLAGPSIVADCRMHCRREGDGSWRIAEFSSEPIFVGNDPFLNAAVVRS
jgi:ketosteroid isomerase-like protein